MHKNILKSSGIYVIINVLNCNVYVGQTKKFNNRDHLSELWNKKDNYKLQDDYNKGVEFVYFTVYSEEKMSKKNLDIYEKMYMILLENLGFNLYNTKIPSDALVSKLTEKDWKNAQEQFIEDFIKLFNIMPEDLIIANPKERKNVLDYYINQRFNYSNDNIKQYLGNRLIFSKERVAHIFSTEEKSIFELDLDELFFSTAGNYIGESLDYILNYEVQTVKKFGYCLWTFASNAISYQTILECCREREKQEKDIYVLFCYTPSNVYSDKDATNHRYLKKEERKFLIQNDLDFLNIVIKDDQYIVPQGIDCTASSASSANAFVIEEFSLIRESFDINELREKYYKVNCGYELKEAQDDYNSSTRYWRQKDNEDLYSIKTEHNSRMKYFVGKLASPYVVKLTCKEGK